MKVHYITSDGKQELKAAVTKTGEVLLTARLNQWVVRLNQDAKAHVVLNHIGIHIRQSGSSFSLTRQHSLHAQVNSSTGFCIIIPTEVYSDLIKLFNYYTEVNG